MTREDRESEIADYVDFLDRVHSCVTSSDSRVTALGFSQGVATVLRWAALGRSRVHRMVLWAGQLPPDLDLSLLEGRLERGVVLVEGRFDEYASWVQEGEHRSRLEGAGLAVEAVQFDGGHRLDDAVLARLAGA